MDAMTSYMNNSYQELDLIESVTNNKLLRLNYEFDKFMMKHRENLIAIEEKVTAENGTYDDLEYLYAMEAEEAKKESKGIIGKIISAVKAFFHKVKEVIFGKKKPDESELPDKLNLPDDPRAVVKEGRGIINRIKSFFTGDKGTARTAATVGGVATAAVLAKTIILPEISNLTNFINDAEAVSGEAETHLDSIEGAPPEEQGIIKGLFNQLKSLGSRATNIMKTINSQEYKDSKIEGKVEDAKQSRKDAWDKIDANDAQNADLQKKIKELIKIEKSLEKKIQGRFGGHFSKNASMKRKVDKWKDLQRTGKLDRKRSEKLGELSASSDELDKKLNAQFKEVQKVRIELQKIIRNNDLRSTGAQIQAAFANRKIEQNQKKLNHGQPPISTAKNTVQHADALIAAFSSAFDIEDGDNIMEFEDNISIAADKEIDYFLESLQ